MVGSEKHVNQHPVEIHCRQCSARFDVPIEQIRSLREMSCPECAALIVLGTSEIRSQIRRIEKAMRDMQQMLAKGSAFQGQNKPGAKAPVDKLPTDMPDRKDRG
jgi:DNA-directed RNA polymerase subunit RPC12/RpoP